VALTDVLLPVLIQDPYVIASEDLTINAIQPVVAKDPSGFSEGPACRRVAIVDFDSSDGSLRPAAVFNPAGSPYANVGMYLVTVPLPARAPRQAPWVRGVPTSRIEALTSRDYDDPFLKVSTFGTVVRTLALVEDEAALGRPVEWAFGGEQLLVVPRAGDLDNAFYHRDSHSLQFYYFTPGADVTRTVYSALSQDIVAHEAAHAVIDGIAPDLYDTVSPQSLGIHESLADLTAVLLTLRNREFLHPRSRSEAFREVGQSGRFSRIAEEFGHSRGHGPALRDVNNRKTLDPRERDPARRVDLSSPHAVSQALSGALFQVVRQTFEVTYDSDDEALLRLVDDKFRAALIYTVNRMASLIFKGLDWLPPGEVSFADCVRAMLAADSYHLPDLAQQREWLLRECQQRSILPRSHRGIPQGTPEEVQQFNLGAVDIDRINSSESEAKHFVDRHRRLLGLPDGSPFEVRSRIVRVGTRRLLDRRHRTEIISLAAPDPQPSGDDADRLLNLKASWWIAEPSDLREEFGATREIKVGATLVLDPSGAVQALLRGGQEQAQAARRSEFLRRLAEVGVLLPPGRSNGPDGRPLQGYLSSEVRSGFLRVAGGLRTLHIAEGIW
jgi:hypothetical protein